MTLQMANGIDFWRAPEKNQMKLDPPSAAVMSNIVNGSYRYDTATDS